MSATDLYIGGAYAHSVSNFGASVICRMEDTVGESKDQSDQYGLYGADGFEGPFSPAYMGRNFELLRR